MEMDRIGNSAMRADFDVFEWNAGVAQLGNICRLEIHDQSLMIPFDKRGIEAPGNILPNNVATRGRARAHICPEVFGITRKILYHRRNN